MGGYLVAGRPVVPLVSDVSIVLSADDSALRPGLIKLGRRSATTSRISAGNGPGRVSGPLGVCAACPLMPGSGGVRRSVPLLWLFPRLPYWQLSVAPQSRCRGRPDTHEITEIRQSGSEELLDAVGRLTTPVLVTRQDTQLHQTGRVAPGRLP